MRGDWLVDPLSFLNLPYAVRESQFTGATQQQSNMLMAQAYAAMQYAPAKPEPVAGISELIGELNGFDLARKLNKDANTWHERKCELSRIPALLKTGTLKDAMEADQIANKWREMDERAVRLEKL